MITTILQVYKRPDYLKEQIEAVRNQSIQNSTDRLIIVHNEGGIDFDYPEGAELIYANPNKMFHLRFAIGLLTNTEYVAFFDDDTIPGKDWYKNCIETIKKHDCICVTNGRIVDRAKQTQYGPGWSNPKNEEVDVDFGGHAWFLRKENLKYMWHDDIIEHKNGEDIQLSANAQIFGNIPTFVPPHPKDNLDLWGSDPFKAMKYGCDAHASWMTRPTHNEERYRLFDKYVGKGWKLLLER